MDRFIGIYYFVDKIEFLTFKIQYGQIYRSFYYENGCSIIPTLKSNMDRFIGEVAMSSNISADYFKIQYGQIYSPIQNAS